MTREENETIKEEYSLRGQPVINLFNHNWNPEVDGKLKAFVRLGYDSFSKDPFFFPNLASFDSLHLVKERSESCGRYGSGTYGNDTDLVLCGGSLVYISYDSINPDFNIPIENSTCRILLFAENGSNAVITRGRLEEICGQSLETRKK
ncbi:MAG TPA: hypothetical protein P5277_04450 [Candidatus Paceibacterota bacterium]|nr:hypothetical protein [Candidatus Paceibacterota bacterium]